MYIFINNSAYIQRKTEKEDRRDTPVQFNVVCYPHPNGQLYAKETSNNECNEGKEQYKKECPVKPRGKDLYYDFLTHVGTDTIFCLHPASFGRQIIRKGGKGTFMLTRTKTVE